MPWVANAGPFISSKQRTVERSFLLMFVLPVRDQAIIDTESLSDGKAPDRMAGEGIGVRVLP